jgi:hypothetical protein
MSQLIPRSDLLGKGQDVTYLKKIAIHNIMSSNAKNKAGVAEYAAELRN